MRSFRKNIEIILLLFVIVGFLVYPNINSAQINPEEVLYSLDKLRLDQIDEKNILRTLTQQIYNWWEDSMVAEVSYSSDNQAVLVILKKAIIKNLFSYATVDLPRQILIDMAISASKMTGIIFAGNLPSAIKEFEKLTVDEAKKYLTELMVKDEIRFSATNLTTSYISYRGNKQDVKLPCIIVYKPINDTLGEVALNIYSSHYIEPPPSTGSSAFVNTFWYIEDWLKEGNTKLSPFIIKITGRIQKVEKGTYKWIGNPEFELIFDQPVPEFDFPEPGFFQGIILTIKEKFTETRLVLENLGIEPKKLPDQIRGVTETIIKSIKNIFSSNTNFKASVGESLATNDGVDLKNINIDNLFPKGNLSDILNPQEEKKQEAKQESAPVLPAPKQMTLEEIQEALDDIAEQIDILKQEIGVITQPSHVVSVEQPEEQEQQEETQQEQEVNVDVSNNSQGGGSVPMAYLVILISEVQIAGTDNEKQEYVKLYNPTDNEVELTDWYLQRKTKTGNSYSSYASSTLFQGKTIKAKDYFTIAREDAGFVGNVYTTNPLTEDNTLALKNPSTNIVDMVGWGEAQEYELLPVQNPEPGKYLERKGDQDTDNNSFDFELKEREQQPVILEEETDAIAPSVVFNVDSSQSSLAFPVIFDINDSSQSSVSPSGLDIFTFRWKEDNGEWQEDQNQQIQGNDYSGQRDFSGQDEKTYLFQINAKDKQGNESGWLPEDGKTVTVSTPKTILINEVNIDGKVGTGGTDDDWVELYNPNDFPVDLSNWSIQKHSKDEPCSINSSFYKKNLVGVIPSKGYFLIVDTEAEDYLKNLADITIGWSLSENNTIYIVRNKEKIADDLDLDIADKVGFGQACYFESNLSENPLEGKSINRKQETDDNSQDFISNYISPTNSKGESYSPIPSFSEAPWPMFQQNSQRTGQSLFAGPSNPTLEVFLQGEDSSDFFYSTAIGSDGTIYALAKINTKEGVYAFNFDSSLKWFYEVPVFDNSLILFEQAKSIFVTSAKGLLAINIETGDLKWKRIPAFFYMINYPALSNGNIYSLAGCQIEGENHPCLMSINYRGVFNWAYIFEKDETITEYSFQENDSLITRDDDLSSVSVSEDGTIYFGYHDKLFAINQDGTKKWERVFEPICKYLPCDPTVRTPSVSEDGTIYVIVSKEADWRALQDGGSSHCFHVLDPEDPNIEKGESDCSRYHNKSVSIEKGGSIYSMSSSIWNYFWLGSYIFSFNNQGAFNWSLKQPIGYRGGPTLVLDKNGIIYTFYEVQNKVIAIDNQKQEIWSIAIPDSLDRSVLSLSGDGSMFISAKNKLYKIGP